MSNDQYILQHYRKLAQNFGLGPNCSIEDPFIRDSETKFVQLSLEKFLKTNSNENLTVLDLGCGNGHLLSHLSRSFPQLQLAGLEFTPELLELAKSRHLPQTTLILGDLRGNNLWPTAVQVVITERSLINILSPKDQLKALQNIAQTLTPGGLYLMMESFKESWMEMNHARRENDLPEVPVSQHNRYLTERAATYLEENGLIEIEGVLPKNFLSSHFFLSRIVHPMVRTAGRKKISHFVAFFDGTLNPGQGNYSPILFRTFRKLYES